MEQTSLLVKEEEQAAAPAPQRRRAVLGGVLCTLLAIPAVVRWQQRGASAVEVDGAAPARLSAVSHGFGAERSDADAFSLAVHHPSADSLAAADDDAMLSSGSAASDDDTPITATVSIETNAGSKMVLFVAATLELTAPAADELDCTIKYYPSACERGSASCATPPLYSSAITFEPEGTRSATLSLYRLIPGADYTYETLCRVRTEDDVSTEASAPTHVAGGNGTFTSLTTGYPRFDARPLGNASGAALGVEMVATIYGLDDAPSNDDQNNFVGEIVFQGLVAVNREGWVVWYYQLMGPTEGNPLQINVFEFLTKHEIALLADANKGSSQLLTIKTTEDNEIQQEYTVNCDGTASAYNALSHELRADVVDGDGVSNLITTAYNVKTYDYPGVPIESDGSLNNVSSWRTDNYTAFLGGTVSLWNRDDNSVTTMYDIFDYFNPKEDKVRSNSWSEGSISCQGGETDGDAPALVGVLDWAHVSSVAVGVENNYLVTLRNLNTVVSLRRDGDAALLWTLSSSLDSRSDFDFAREEEKFYQPHHVSQLPNGNVLLVDDGNDRPGCVEGGSSASSYDGCYSRAVMYALNTKRGRATLVWQYEFPKGLATAADDDGAAAAKSSAALAKFAADARRAGAPVTLPEADALAASSSPFESIAGRKKHSSSSSSDADADSSSSDALATSTTAMESENDDAVDVFTHDAFTFDGGSVERLSNGNFLVGFTAVAEEQRAWNPAGSMLLFEVDDAGDAVGAMEFPRPVQTSGVKDGGYRMLPWASIGGESSSSPV